jgi:hypothetical protein
MEYQALTQPGIKLVAKDLGVQLVNYGDLVGSKSAGANEEEGSNLN